jgi:hypothetical protein
MRLTCSGWILVTGLFCFEAAAAELPESARAAYDAHQAILSQGWKTTPAEAAQLESQLARHPQDVAARTRLISYYYQQMIAARRARHILWLIENHPEADVFLVASDVTQMAPAWHGLNSAADWEEARMLWLREAERFSSHPTVLANAAQALPVEDSMRLMRRLRSLEPSNAVWTVNLASIYARAVRDVFYAGEPAAGRGFAGWVRYRETWHMALPFAGPALAAKLKKELETSSDAGLVGATGELLVEEPASLGENGQAPEAMRSAAFGKQLLERARQGR